MPRSLSFFFVFLWSFFSFLSSVSANMSDHLVISEVIYGNTNASDEFIELYNPTNEDINIKELGLKLHIRNSKGTSDTNKSIEWKNEIIPAYGYFLFASKTSESYANQANALYSAALVNDGAVYISLAQSKLLEVIDFISWGNHASPEGFENQIANSFSSSQSIERKSSENNNDIGNAWDTDANDFIIQDIPSPQNSLSEPEIYTQDQESIEEISQIQDIIAYPGIENVFLSWDVNENFQNSSVIIKTDTETFSFENTGNATITNLTENTLYTFTFSLTENGASSPSSIITFQTLPNESESLPNIENVMLTEKKQSTLSFSWEIPDDERIENILVRINGGELQNIGKVETFRFESLEADSLYLFEFHTQDSDGDLSELLQYQEKTSPLPDITPPSEISSLNIVSHTNTLELFWQNPLDPDFSNIHVAYGLSGEILNENEAFILGKRESLSLENLEVNSLYQIYIQTEDSSGNISPGLNFYVSTKGCSSENQLIINEIAWAGMAALATEDQALSYGHRYQWIELYNTGENILNLEGWKIISSDGHEILLDSLNVFPHDFLILQNSEQEIFTGEIIPDLFYSDPKNTEGDDIRLSESTTNIQLINQCNEIIETIPFMFKGDYQTYRTMARLDPELPADQEDSWFHGKLNGSPGEENTYSEINLSIAYIIPEPYHPIPNEDFQVRVLVSNLHEETAFAEDWALQILDENNMVLSSINGTNLENYADNIWLTLDIPGQSEGDFMVQGNILCAQECGEYANLSQNISIHISPRINEVYPKPQDGEEEWIELYNPLDEEYSLEDSQICIQNKDCFEISGIMAPQGYFLLFESDFEEWSGLTDSDSEITWKDSEWMYNDEYIEEVDNPEDEWIYQESIKDIFAYTTPHIKKSFARKSNGIIEESSHITQGLDNNYNQEPLALIDVQNSGNTSGYAPFYLNLNGENSSDPDGDELLFLWDFGEGTISHEENPAGIYYNNPGTYTVTLTVNDGFGMNDSKSIDISVQRKSSSGGGSSPEIEIKTRIPAIIPEAAQDWNVGFSQLSINDSQRDWIELQCYNCSEDIHLYRYKLYDDKVFYEFQEDAFLKKNQSLRIYLEKEMQNIFSNNFLFIEKKNGLTKTDEQIVLLNPDGQISDAVCWNNFDSTVSKSEASEELNLKQSHAWEGDCINSQELKKKDTILLRKNQDTQTAEDWSFIEPPQKPQKESIPPDEEKSKNEGENKAEVFQSGIYISEIFINPKGKDKGKEWIEIYNFLDSPINVQNWSIHTQSQSITLENYILASHEFFLISKEKLKLSLTNKQGILELKNPQGEIIQTIRYENAQENVSFARNTYGAFQWTSIKTPLSKNILIPQQKESIDNDYDGLSDTAEIILGTDPYKRDSDNDQFPDKFELEHNMNPHVFDHKDLSSFSDFLLEQTNIRINKPRTNSGELSFSGTSEPYAKIKLYLHSKPRILHTQADKFGKWKIALSSLEAGEHKYWFQIFDILNISSQKSPEQTFFLEKAIQREKKEKRSFKEKKSTPLLWHMNPQNFISKVFKKAIEDKLSSKENYKEDFLPSHKEQANIYLYILSSFCFFLFAYFLYYTIKRKDVLFSEF